MLIDVTRTNCATATGTQDITADLGGADPVAAILMLTQADTDATPANGAAICIGFTDGSTDRCCSISDEHGVTTTSNQRFQTSTLIRITLDGEVANSGEAAFDRWVADGIRIDWTTAATDNYLVTAIFFSGLDVSAKVKGVSLTTQDTNTHVEDIGFTSDIIFAMTTGMVDDDPGGRANGKISLGVATAAINASLAWFSDVAQTSCKMTSRLATNRCVMEVDKNYLSWSAQISGIDAAGFDCYARDNDANNDIDVLCLGFDNAQATAVVMDTPTTSGTALQTMGFAPTITGLIASDLQASDALVTTDDAGVFGLGVFNSANEYCIQIASEDGASTTNTQSLSDDTAVNFPYDTGTAMFAGSFVSFVPTGFNLNYSATDGTARKWIAWAVEGASADTIEPVQGTIRFTGNIPTVLQGSGAVIPETKALVITGNQPNLIWSKTVSPLQGTINVIGNVPIAAFGAIIVETKGTKLFTTGHLPTVEALGWIPSQMGTINAWAQLPDECKEL